MRNCLLEYFNVFLFFLNPDVSIVFDDSKWFVLLSLMLSLHSSSCVYGCVCWVLSSSLNLWLCSKFIGPKSQQMYIAMATTPASLPRFPLLVFPSWQAGSYGGAYQMFAWHRLQLFLKSAYNKSECWSSLDPFYYPRQCACVFITSHAHRRVRSHPTITIVIVIINSNSVFYFILFYLDGPLFF